MTVDDLERECDRVEAVAKEFSLPYLGFITVKLNRRVRGDTCRIAPGLSGKVLQWGDGKDERFPTVVSLKVEKVREFIKRARKEATHDRP